MIAAIKRQLDEVAYAHTSFFTSQPMEDLADLLIEDAPPGIAKAYFVWAGGSDRSRTEARASVLRRDRTTAAPASSRVARGSGNTLGARSVGGNEWRRRQFAPLLIDVSHIAPCYAYRDRRDDELEAEYGRRVADELESRILELGPDNIIGFVAEPVVGATAGAVAAVPGYFRCIRKICDRYGVLLILDEIMCGMGRTGTLHACEQEGIAPDIMTIAKGLGGGYQPVGAMLASGRITEAIASGSGVFQHGHTYIGHATACAAALAVQQVIREENLLDNVRTRGAELEMRLQERLGNRSTRWRHPRSGAVLGFGARC